MKNPARYRNKRDYTKAFAWQNGQPHIATTRRVWLFAVVLAVNSIRFLCVSVSLCLCG